MISQKTRSSLAIIIGTISVVLGAFVLVAFASGYNIDLLRGEIVTTCLVLLNTNPRGASIKINNKTLTQKTPYRLDGLKTGPITIEYNKAEYHNWKTSFFIKAGEVTFADYALLIPNNIQVKQLDTKINFSAIRNSSDGSKVFGFGSSPAAIYEIKSDDHIRKIVDLPIDSSPEQIASIDPIDIAQDGSAILLKTSYESGNSVIYWVNSVNGELVSLSTFIPQGMKSMRINPRNNRDILALLNGQLQHINIESRTIFSTPINNINSYNIDRENIYTLENLEPAVNGQFLVRYDPAGNNRYVLYQYESMKNPGEIVLSKLRGQSSIAILNPDNGVLSMIRQQDGKILSSVIGSGIKQPVFSRSGRFITYLQDNHLKTIDIEFIERFSVDQNDISYLIWLTDFQLLVTKPDGLYIVDFTGENLIKIPPNITPPATTQSAINKNSKTIYYLENSKLNTYTLEPQAGLIDLR
jgi:hypothetical protein